MLKFITKQQYLYIISTKQPTRTHKKKSSTKLDNILTKLYFTDSIREREREAVKEKGQKREREKKEWIYF